MGADGEGVECTCVYGIVHAAYTRAGQVCGASPERDGSQGLWIGCLRSVLSHGAPGSVGEMHASGYEDRVHGCPRQRCERQAGLTWCRHALRGGSARLHCLRSWGAAAGHDRLRTSKRPLRTIQARRVPYRLSA
jgi:hypothetical protein